MSRQYISNVRLTKDQIKGMINEEPPEVIARRLNIHKQTVKWLIEEILVQEPWRREDMLK